MNEVKVFNFEASEVRTIVIENEVWFVGKDVAEALGYSNTNKAVLTHVDVEDKTQSQNGNEFGQRGATLINQSGVISLALSSTLPTARKFKRWVTSEVIPNVLKHGNYQLQQSTQLNETLSDFESRLKHLEQENLLSAIQYNHLGRLVANRVSEVENSFDFEILPIQHIELTKDINEGIYRISGVKSRTQLQSKDYDMVIKFVTEWQPSTAKQVVINNIRERQLCS